MKKPLPLLIGMFFSILSYGQVSTTNLVKSYLFTGGSLQNTISPGVKDLVKTGSASTLVASNYLIADDAISLNGDYMHGGTSSASNVLTISMWVKTSTSDLSTRYIFSQFNDTPGFGVKCYLQNGRVVFGGNYKTSSSTSAFNSVTSINSVADGKWHHVAAVVSYIYINSLQGDQNYYGYTLYIDGVSQGVANNASTMFVISLLDNATNFMIGVDNSLTGVKYEDAIDDIRYYQRTLPVSEVQTLYLDGIPEGPVYVNKTATGNNDGTSWANAYTDLQSALSSYVEKKTIWVAAGTYTPHASNRKGTFYLPNKCKIYGGFNGSETDLTQRNPKANITVLSGDLLGNDNSNVLVTEATRQDNAFHVVSLKGSIQNVVMDGFTISGGNAGGDNAITCGTAAINQYHDQRGAAIYANPYATGHRVTATIRNCILEKNTAYNIGVYSPYSPCGVQDVITDIDFENCIVRNNRTRDLSAMLFSGNSSFNIYSRGSLVNSLFYDNISDNGSSCLYMAASASNGGTLMGIDVQIINSTFANNIGLSGNVMTMSVAANTAIRNSIIYGNGSSMPFAITTTGSVVNNSIVQGGQQGGFNVDPLYKSPIADDYSLTCGSPAIDVGNDTYISLPTDLAGGNRKNSTVDLGAYEFVSFSGITTNSKNITVQLDASGNASITPDQIDNGSGAVCGVAFTLSLDKATFTCADLGENEVTLTATEDVGGAFATATATVTVEDSVDPLVITQNITIQLDENGNAGITASAVNNGSTDNCTEQANLILVLDKTAFTCADLGENTVTLTVTDAFGNQSAAVATVTVEDEVVPNVITKDIVVQLDASGNATIAAASVNDGTTDNCTDAGSLALSLDKVTFTCSDLGVNTVTLTAEDASGNTATATASVTVEDNIVPTVVTKNITVNLDITGNALILASDINDASVDNCTSQNNLTLSIDINTFTVADVGANTVTLTVEDESGNSNTATSTVTVVNKLSQLITFDELADKVYTDGSFPLVATASSQLPVSFSIVSGPATIDGNTVSITGVGDVTIEATQAGDDEYFVAPAVQQSFTIGQAVLTVTAENKSITYGDALPALTYAYSGFATGESAEVLTSEPVIATVATANSDAGEYSITVTGGSAANYTFAYLNGVLTINKANQTINVEPFGVKNVSDADFALPAVSSVELPISYTSSNTAVAIILNPTAGRANSVISSGPIVSIVGAGSTTITASQPGNTNYNAAVSIENVLVVNKQDQTIVFETIQTHTVGEAPFAISATASSGLEVSFSTASTKITLDGNQVALISAGSVTVEANQSGNETYSAAASVTRTFCINPAKPVITADFSDISAPVLTSSESAGNQWFRNGTAINTATSQTFVPTEAGLYTVRATIDGCASQLSDEFTLLVTSAETNISERVLNIYPNPAVDKVIIQLPQTKGTKTVAIYSANGNVVFTHSTDANELEVNTLGYASGVSYVIVNTADGKSFAGKLIKK